MIHLICTVADFQADRIPEFVSHYATLGVERFWITVHHNSTDMFMTTSTSGASVSARATQHLASMARFISGPAT
jgi:hypothetical protein